MDVLESGRENAAESRSVGTHFGLPTTMIGTDDGGGVRIRGTLQQRQLARTLRRLREESGLSL
ncbi:MAG: hypothetical protein ACRDTT_20725, partial [Pseudonocardiaceae bacterium]